MLADVVVNKGFLFATSSRKIKSHVVERQITLLVWPCLNHLQENIAQINHMIIFNDSVSKFYQYCIVKLFSVITKLLAMNKYINRIVAFEAFADAHLWFLVSASAEKNAEVIKFLRILKKCLRQ